MLQVELSGQFCWDLIQKTKIPTATQTVKAVFLRFQKIKHISSGTGLEAIHARYWQIIGLYFALVLRHWVRLTSNVMV